MNDLYWLSEAQMDQLRPYFSKSLGLVGVDNRYVIYEIIVINHDGLKWCDVPSEYGLPKTLYNHWKRWSDMGVFARVIMELAEQAPDNRAILIDATQLKLYCPPQVLVLK